MTVKELAKKYKQDVINLRREFHKYPEASLKEFKTSKKIKEELDKLSIPCEIVADTGVVADIKGEKPGKTVLLRADIDGLSVTELNECEFKSQHEGFMHACGHDCHISMLLGAAMILNDIKGELKGTARLVFQPAEEVAQGAKKMIKAGVLEGVDGVFGMHIWSNLEAGSVCIQEGPLMASADFFTIRVKGKGGHGSAPHQGVDAVIASSAIVMNLQSVVSREINPLESAVVSVGSIKSGTRFNVIASEGILEGTTRCFNPEIRDDFPRMIERIAKDTASTFRAEAELEYGLGTAVVINDGKSSKRAEKSVEKIGAKAVVIEKITGAEDFSEYMNRVPGVLALVGTGNEDKGACYPQHHPKYTVDEDSLEIGSALYAQYTQDFLNE
ncbi:M20 family metallopeptidase [Clostridium magnum]|uniref:Putative hydrolase YxeP n=1 Tax=Clostridium magnum DSM 2767 TaxID=1121326 RepID=A0A161YM05_9CLOT|nr:M20 family metallopeptidase [Clostridium magnum]KZL91662.1 putative hydrolase YxeP [Clostridium magnum DSM 2767]SHH51478.1 amidohydrolase [Clostridium magnum DSM 2767]